MKVSSVEPRYVLFWPNYIDSSQIAMHTTTLPTLYRMIKSITPIELVKINGKLI